MKRSQRKKYKGLDRSEISSSDESSHSEADRDAEQINVVYTENVFKKYDNKNILLNMWLWFKENPQSKLPFLYFVIATVVFLVLGIFYILDNDSAFIISGLFGLITACYALNHFRGLMLLKREIDSFHSHNKQFRIENIELTQAVERLTRAQSELKNVHTDLQDINARTKESNMKFRQIEQNLRVANLDSIKGIEDIRSKATQIAKHWRDSLMQRERNVVIRVYDRLEILDQKEGVSKEEFDHFAELLPLAYRERFDRLGTFNKLASGKSVIDYDDLQLCLDVFAEMDVDDCDIEFEIQRTPTIKQGAGDNDVALSPMDAARPMLIRTKRSRPGTSV